MNLQGGFRLPCQTAPSTCGGSPAFRRPAGNAVGMSRSRTWPTGQGTGPIVAAWVTVFTLGDSFSGKSGRVSMAGPYGPPASDVVHKYLNNQSLVPNQGLDSADPDSIPLLLLLQLWSGGGGGCEGTLPSGIGTRHAVAFSGREGGGSRRASCCGTGAQPERGTLREPGASLPNVIHWGWRGAPAPSNPDPGGVPP